MKCLYIKPNLTSKHGLKCIKIASTDILNLKIFSGEIPRTLLSEKGKIPPLVLSPYSGLRPSRNAYGVQWPYHFSKPDDGPAKYFYIILNIISIYIGPVSPIYMYLCAWPLLIVCSGNYECVPVCLGDSNLRTDGWGKTIGSLNSSTPVNFLNYWICYPSLFH